MLNTKKNKLVTYIKKKFLEHVSRFTSLDVLTAKSISFLTPLMGRRSCKSFNSWIKLAALNPAIGKIQAQIKSAKI